MVKNWAEDGYECYCVDIQHSIRNAKKKEFNSGGSITYAWGDVRSWTPPEKDIHIIFAFPPCTDLTVAGARDFETKRGYRLSDALELFDACVLAGSYSRRPYMVENPVGRLSSCKRKPDHLFDPCDFAGYLETPLDLYTKKTCIWSANGFIFPELKWVEPTEGSKIIKMAPSPERANLRSATPAGFARAVFLANKLPDECQCKNYGGVLIYEDTYKVWKCQEFGKEQGTRWPR